MKNKLIVLIFIVLAGFGMRISGDYYEWIDEVLFINNQNFYNQYGLIEGIGMTEGREMVPSTICYFLGIDTVFKARWLAIIAGTLCSLAIFFISKNKTYGLIGAFFIAVCPLLIYWSEFIRPYTIAALFVILGYRWKFWYYPAIFTTPMAIIGINWYELKSRKTFYIILAIISIVFYQQMSQVSQFNHWRDFGFIISARRIWVIPVVSLVCHLVCMPDDRKQRLQRLPVRLVEYAKAGFRNE